MRLVLLGTAGYHPNPSRHTLCMLLPACGVMLDAGSGMFRAGRYLQTTELDIFLTHAHLDHVVGLSYLFDVLYEHPLERVTVHGLADKLAAIDEHLFAAALFPKKPPCRYEPLAGPCALPGGGRISYFPLEHPGGSLGFRLDWPGHSMAYVTDTTASLAAPYVEQIRGVDLLVHECYFPDAQTEWAKKTGHSWTSAVAQLAAAAGVGRLVLTHLNPLARDDGVLGVAAAHSIFSNMVVGHDEMAIEF
jgi:ribonuclease Z